MVPASVFSLIPEPFKSVVEDDAIIIKELVRSNEMKKRKE
jgi:hypothetical protein